MENKNLKRITDIYCAAFALLALACFALSPTAQAKPPQPTPTPTATPTPTPVPTQTFAAGFDTTSYRGGGPVIKSSPGSVLTVVGTMSPVSGAGSTGVFVLLFDKATAPVAGDIPVLAIWPDGPCVSNSAKMLFNYTGQGLPFSNGISWAVSTSPVVLQTATNMGSTQITVTFEEPSMPTQRFSSTVSGAFLGGYQPTGEVVKASPGTVFTASATSYNTGVFVLFFDKATPPVIGDVPILAIDTWWPAEPACQGSSSSHFASYAETPLHFANGMSWAISSSPAVLTPFSSSVAITTQVTITYQ